MKNSAKCIKVVPYQEILNLRDLLERLESWQEPLKVLESYFTNPTAPINKKQVVRQYYACSQLFQTFNLTYNDLLAEATQSLEILVQQQTLASYQIE